MDHFDLHAPFSPTGDQPEAIAKLVQGIRDVTTSRLYWALPVPVKRTPLPMSSHR